MKRFLFLVLLLSAVVPAGASVVIHDGRPGIVAMRDWDALDSEGRVWSIVEGSWIRTPQVDPPVPVDQIKFWDVHSLLTADNVAWRWTGEFAGWVNFGTWPASTVPNPESWAAAAAVSPNPAAGSCHVSFAVEAPGPAAVRVFDVAGRQVRALLEAELPAGACSVSWDGRDDAGQPAPAGVYFARIETAAGAQAVRVVLTR